MLIVDAHCHVSPCWYEPVESLVDQMDRNGVDHAVLIQMQGQYDNEYLFECERRYPGRFASVVLVNTAERDAARQLQDLTARGARGIRLRPNDPWTIWREARDLGLVVSCFGTPQEFSVPAFSELLSAFPKLPVIIEHLGGITALDESLTAATRDAVLALGQFRNAHMKIHGLGEFCRRKVPLASDFSFERSDLPILHRACDAFAERLVWGSDFPPVSAREGYTNSLRLPLIELESRPQAERAEIFGGVAARLFGLSGKNGLSEKNGTVSES